MSGLGLAGDGVPDRPGRLTVVPVEPGFAEINADGLCVGVAFADFYMRWTVRLFAAPFQRQTNAVEPYIKLSLRAVRADVRERLEREGAWWTDG